MRLRLSALQSAIKKGPVAAFRGGQGATAVAVDSAAGNGAAGRYPLRERRATKGALAEAMLMRSKPICLTSLIAVIKPGCFCSALCLVVVEDSLYAQQWGKEVKVQKISSVQSREDATIVANH